MIPNLTVDEVMVMMGDHIDDLTDENYHTEAGYVEDQMEGLKSAVKAGLPVGYFSYHGGDVVGFVEFVVVSE